MHKWLVFGFGNYLSDIFDIIHANRGRIKTIVKNIIPTEKQLENLKHRISLLDYKVQIIDLNDFQPKKNEKYCCGFVNGRDKLVPYLKQKYKIKFDNLNHPTSYFGSNVSFGEGVCVGVHTVVGPNCKIGNFCSINRASSIGHDTVLGDFSTIAPGVTIAGIVKIGSKTTIGIGATIMNNIRIGENSIVGAGAVVINEVPDEVVVAGVPAKILRKNKSL